MLLCSEEILECFPSHDKASYFKMDKSWLREGGFKEEVVMWWSSQVEGVATSLKDYSDTLLGKEASLRGQEEEE